MADIRLRKLNSVYMKVDCEPAIAQELFDYFAIRADGYKFHPAYKNRQWDGFLRLYKYSQSTLWIGLHEKLKNFADTMEYAIEVVDDFISPTNIPVETIAEFIKGLDLHAGGERIEARDHQLSGIHRAICHQRATLLSPTASGKSLLIYALARFYEAAVAGKTLIVVPNTSLVEQMYSDFADYSSNSDWNVEDRTHKIYAGKDKNADKDIVISTWQSIYKLGKGFFEQFTSVISDETHGVKGKSLTNIMENLVNADFRIGLTGTMGSAVANHLVIQGLLGPVLRLVSSAELMAKKEMSKLKVECVCLRYNKSDHKTWKSSIVDLGNDKKRKMNYAEEVEFLQNHQTKNNFITNLAGTQEGNTLVLFNHVAHGQILTDMIASKFPSKRVYFIHGKVRPETREIWRKEIEAGTDAIVLATYGTYSTGVNIKALDQMIFASSTKSQIRTLQSIGRTLRIIIGVKEYAKVYDIIDDLSDGKKTKNYSVQHFAERVKYYVEEEFDYGMYLVDL